MLALVPDVYDLSPGQRYRIEQWDPHLLRSGVEITYVPFLSAELRAMLTKPGGHGGKAWSLISAFANRLQALREAKQFDVVYVYREIAVLGPAWLESYLAYLKLPVVFDFDDAIFLRYISTSNGYFSLLKFPSSKTRALCRLSAHVMVGNEYLASYARQFNQNVSVIPTTIDLTKYTLFPKPANEVPVIGWTGSHSTVRYLSLIRQALERVATIERFRLRLIGSSGQQFDLANSPVEAVAWNSLTEADDLRVLDVGIMPMPDDLWARGKCACKALQYMALGIPVVCSGVGVVNEIIQDGVNGFLANSEEEWIEKLVRLLRDPHLRQDMGMKGRQTVESRFSGASWAREVGRIFRSAAGVAEKGQSRTLSAACR